MSLFPTDITRGLILLGHHAPIITQLAHWLTSEAKPAINLMASDRRTTANYLRNLAAEGAKVCCGWAGRNSNI